jgi:hypothetical protein
MQTPLLIRKLERWLHVAVTRGSFTFAPSGLKHSGYNNVEIPGYPWSPSYKSNKERCPNLPSANNATELGSHLQRGLGGLSSKSIPRSSGYSTLASRRTLEGFLGPLLQLSLLVLQLLIKFFHLVFDKN